MSDNVEKDESLESNEAKEVKAQEEVLKENSEPQEAPVEEKVEETTPQTEEVAETDLEPQVEEKVEEPEVKEEVVETPKKEKKAKKEKVKEEPKEEIQEIVEEPKKDEKDTTVKSDVEKKIRKQIEKKQEKKERMGIYRIGEYLKEEHKWENWLFLSVSVIVLALGLLILNGSLIVREDFPLIGSYPKVFAWVLVIVSSIGVLYALYPFFKPAFPEFKKITWLTMPKFWANVLRVFIFMAIFVGLFILYDTLMAELFILIFRN